MLANVLPQIVSGMVQISREEPEDPIDFLERFIRRLGQETETNATKRVRDQFFRIIKEIEGK